MTIKYIGNGVYLAFGKYLGNPCLCEAGSHYEALCVCDFCGLDATDEQYIYGPGVIHHDVECGHCNASYCFDDYSQVT